MTKIPKVADLNAEYAQVLREKKEAYAEYRKVRDDMKEYLIAKQNVETILGMDRKQKDKEQEQHR